MNRRRLNGRLAKRGFTYLELMASSVIVGMLGVGLGSVLIVTSQTMNSHDSVVAKRATAAEITGDILEDMRHAIQFMVRNRHEAVFTIPDRDGDALPEKVRYAWGGNPGDSLTYSLNGSPPVVLASDVHQFDLNYLTEQMQAADPPSQTQVRVLFMVGNQLSLTARESSRVALLESWGYQVNLLDDDALGILVDACLLINDVVYVSADVRGSALGTKLNSATIGVVSEDDELPLYLGMTSGALRSVMDSEIKVKENEHYITQDYPRNSKLDVVASGQLLHLIEPANAAPDLVMLCQAKYNLTDMHSLSVLDAGGNLAGGGQAAGRRAHLPWGNAAVASLSGDGQYLLKRALEWGGGAGDSAALPKLLMVVVNSQALSVQEQACQGLLEQFGYQITAISASEPQSSLDMAVSGVDVVYVCSGVRESVLGTKLRAATVGIVNASNELHSELGTARNDGDLQVLAGSIEVLNNRHYITQDLQTGDVSIFSLGFAMSIMGGVSKEADLLANEARRHAPALVALDVGKQMEGADRLPAPGRRVSLPWGPTALFSVGNLNQNGRTILQRSLEWAAGADLTIRRALMVTRRGSQLSGDERKRFEKLEEFGYQVSLIAETETAAAYEDALKDMDVVFICGSIDAARLGNKLNATKVGIVCEDPEMHVVLGFANGVQLIKEQNLRITNNSHFITQSLSLGVIELSSRAIEMPYLGNSVAAGVQRLGTQGSDTVRTALAAIAAGDALHDASAAAGRRVALPWDGDADFRRFNDVAFVLFERALLWASGSGDAGEPGSGLLQIGYQKEFSLKQGGVNSGITAMKVQLSQAATLRNLNGYFYDEKKKLRFAVYADAGGEPGNLVVQSNAISPDGEGPQWSIADVGPISLAPGTYWLAFAIESHKQEYFYEANPAQPVRFKNYNAISRDFPSVWGSSDASYQRNISLFGTFEPL